MTMFPFHYIGSDIHISYVTCDVLGNIMSYTKLYLYVTFRGRWQSYTCTVSYQHSDFGLGHPSTCRICMKSIRHRQPIRTPDISLSFSLSRVCVVSSLDKLTLIDKSPERASKKPRGRRKGNRGVQAWAVGIGATKHADDRVGRYLQRHAIR